MTYFEREIFWKCTDGGVGLAYTFEKYHAEKFY